MSIPYDADSLISSLARPLAAHLRPAFRAACEQAVASLPCPGEGAAWRAVKPLQRVYFVDPPTDLRAQWDIAFERPCASKLLSKPPIERDVDGRHLRYRQPKAAG